MRMLDATPVTLTHKFGVIYVADGQQTESQFLSNTGGSAQYEEFLRGLGKYISLADCRDDIFTGGLDRSLQSRDGQMALFWRNRLVQCVFFVGTLMTNEPGPEQVNKKRFIGNTYVKVIYSDSAQPFALSSLSGQFNLVVVVVAPTSPGYFRVTVLRPLEIKLAGPRMATTLVTKNQLPMLVRRIMIDADVTAMIARNGEFGYSSNWQERLKQVRQIRRRYSAAASATAAKK